MYCQKCGNEISENEMYCKMCGTRVIKDTEETTIYDINCIII